MLNRRCLALLEHLFESGHVEKIPSLAQRYSISVRTAQYDLGQIDKWLAWHDLPRLIRQRGLGVALPQDRRIRESLSGLASSLGPREYRCSPPERKYILLDRLLASGPVAIPISRLAGELGFSEATIFGDIGEARDYAARYGLRLISRPNVGSRIEGDEAAIRRLYADLLWDLLALSGGLQQGPGVRWLIDEWCRARTPIGILQEMEIPPVVEAVLRFESSSHVALTDQSFARLCLNLAIWVHRSRAGFAMSLPRQTRRHLRAKAEHPFAGSMARRLSAHYGFAAGAGEVAQVTCLLLGSEVQDFGDTKSLYADEPVYLESLAATTAIVKGIESRVCIPLADPAMMLDIALGLRAFLYRRRFGLPEDPNPHLADLKRRYPQLYEATRASMLSVLGERTPEDEVGSVALHIAATTSRSVLEACQHGRIRVLVVCGTGLGTGKLLSARLQSEFDDFEIVAVEPRHNLRNYLPGTGYDLLVSTIPLEDGAPEYVKVSPFLTGEDIQRLRSHLRLRLSKAGPRLLLTRIVGLVADRVGMDDFQRLQVEIQVLQDLLASEEEERGDIRRPGFLELLSPEAIQLQQTVGDWREAIRCAGRPLVALGYVSEHYIDAMIDNKERLGEYIVIVKGVAFPHALPEDGVQRTGFSLLTLTRPVAFGHPRHDPVDIVIAMAASNAWIHTEALSQLLRILDSKSGLRGIRAAGTPAAAIEACQEIVGLQSYSVE